VTWNYGNFLQSLLNLLIIGLVLFGFVKMYIWLSKAFKQKKEEAAAAAAPTTAPCPQCLEPINVLAIRCRHCTSWLDPEAQLPKSFTNLRDAERAKQEAVAAAAAAAAAAASAINDSDEEFPASRQRPISKRSLLD
jgi:hypothetical protein